MSVSQARRAAVFQLQGSASAKVLWSVKPRDQELKRPEWLQLLCEQQLEKTPSLGPGNGWLHFQSNRSHGEFEGKSIGGFQIQS